ncbi:MAG TPA: histidine kinase [Streptosporangiaceae bacterium]
MPTNSPATGSPATGSRGPGSPGTGPPRPPLLQALAGRQRLGIAAALTALAAAAALALAVIHQGHAPGPALDLIVLLCIPAASFGRRWPLPFLALAGTAAAAQMAWGTASPLASVVLGVAGYAVAASVPRRLSIRAVLAAAAIFGAALLYAGLTKGLSPLAAGAILGFLPLAAGWFIGDSMAARRRYLAGLAEQAERERAAEAERGRREVREERVRIARELHDVVAHTLAVITVQAGVGRRLMARRPEEAGTALESIEMIGRTAQDELRVVLGLLRDEDAGAAAPAPVPRLADLKELVDTVRASGTPVELHTSGTDRELSPALELTLYRVVQEALTNVVRHAPQARATVDLSVSAAQVRLEVADDGGTAGRTAGDQERPGLPGTGQGIVGMRERIAAFGGRLVAEPLARGFRVLAEVPIEDAM